MSQRIRNKNKKSRALTYLWIVALAAMVSLLIYFEQTALLYVFSTLGVTVLLVIVSLSDLGQSELSSADDNSRSGGAASPRAAK